MPVIGPRLLASVAAMAAVGVGGLAYSVWEAGQYTLREVTVPLPRPQATGREGDLRILHLSDLHLSARNTDRVAWVRRLGDLRPDLTVVTGDFCGGSEGPELAVAALEPLLDRPGLFVHGSNDYYAPTRGNPASYLSGPSTLGDRSPLDLTVLTQALAQAGWADLNNSRSALSVAGWTVDARGVDDPHIGRDRYDTVTGPFDQSAGLRLGVAHAPYRRILDGMADDGADLILAGHTHGGQLCLPFVGALVTNCDLPRRQASGLSQWPPAALHVSAGLGTNPYTPVRFACRPEATLLTLRP